MPRPPLPKGTAHERHLQFFVPISQPAAVEAGAELHERASLATPPDFLSASQLRSGAVRVENGRTEMVAQLAVELLSR